MLIQSKSMYSSRVHILTLFERIDMFVRYEMVPIRVIRVIGERND